jgi:hypothetical protein
MKRRMRVQVREWGDTERMIQETKNQAGTKPNMNGISESETETEIQLKEILRMCELERRE